VLRGRIKEYLIEHRMTSVFVTHDQTEAVALSDRIAVMSNGVLQQFASPEDLKERPANLFVAGFIGEPAMNLLPARLALQDGRLDAVVQAQGDAGIALRVSFGALERIGNAAALHDGQKVHLGVRPHKVSLGHSSGCANPAQGTLAFNQWQGDQSHVGIDLGGHTLLVVTDGAVDLGDGGGVGLCLPTEALHLFDSDSERALVHGADLR
jgi:multiple sugar transport system ATP-binding protein